MLLDWSIIVIGICLSYYNIYFFPLSCLIIGNRQHALAILGHDGSHQLVVPKNKFLNNLFTNLFVFYPFGISLKEYRDFHWDHHRNTNTDKDPEIPLKEVWPNKMVGPFTTKKVILHSLLDLIGFGVPQLLAFLFYVRPKSVRNATAPIIFFSIVALMLISGFWLALLLWIVSFGTVFWSCFRLRVWSEHVGLDEHETLLFKPNLIQKIWFLPHNTWCHWAHHKYPGVSFNKLPDLQHVEISLCTARKLA